MSNCRRVESRAISCVVTAAVDMGNSNTSTCKESNRAISPTLRSTAMFNGLISISEMLQTKADMMCRCPTDHVDAAGKVQSQTQMNQHAGLAYHVRFECTHKSGIGMSLVVMLLL